MTTSNWILMIVLIVLVIVLVVVIILAKKKARNYEGICGVNRGQDDEHLNDDLL